MSVREWIGVGLAALAIGVALAICDGSTARADAPPPSPAQQRPDIFPCNGCVFSDQDGDGDADMQDLNPITRKLKATRTKTYRLRLISGCSMGSYPAMMAAYEAHVLSEFGYTATRNDTFYDHTVYVSCGLVQINKCGSVNVFCLPDGFPYNGDVYMSDVLSGWDAGSQIGITCHEVCGHADATWNEQYQACGSSCGFAPTPNLRDFMNTGAQSRHGVEAIECARWMRTMWADPPCAVKWGFVDPTYPYYDPARGCHNYGYWCFHPSAIDPFFGTAGTWIDPQNVSEWDPALADGKQYNRRLQTWFWQGVTKQQNTGGDTWKCVSFCFPGEGN